MATGTPTNRTNITLPPEISREILAKMQTESAVMRLARQIELPGRGVAIPVITADPEAAWVGETSAKPVSNPGVGTKIMEAYKLAVIVPFSNEFRRDAAALYDELVRRLPLALAQKFDATVVGAVVAPGANFDSLGSAQKQEIGTATYAGIIAADADISTNGGLLNGFALSPQGRGAILAATDLQGRPLFVNNVAEGAVPMILGAPVVLSKGMHDDDVVGIAGDWSQALYGTVEGVVIDYSSDATLTYKNQSNQDVTINLFQQNMFAVRAEIEIGFRADVDCFNLLTVTTESES